MSHFYCISNCAWLIHWSRYTTEEFDELCFEYGMPEYPQFPSAGLALTDVK